MTAQELENYILSKPNAQKTVIAEYDYIRYTVYSTMFASMGKSEFEIVLTLWGKYPQYETMYPCVIVPAVDNEPKHFTSILLSCKNVPDHVLKSMIDYSYRERMNSIIMPKNCSQGDSCEPYDFGMINRNSEFVATGKSNYDIVCKNFNCCADKSSGVYNDAGNENIPYNLTNSKKMIESFVKLLKISKK